MVFKSSAHEKLICKSQMPELRKVCAKILCHAKQYNYSDDDLFAIHLAMEEAMINAVRHGNKQDPDRNVIIEYDLTPEKIEICVTDQGTGFDPCRLPDPRVGENIFKPDGRGVLLIRSYMDKVEYNQTGNSVRMTKFNSKNTSALKVK